MKDDRESAVSFKQGEAERGETVQPGEFSGGILLMCIHACWEGAKKMEMGSSQWYLVT